MAGRNNFSKSTKAEIAKRAMTPTGFRCEKCGLISTRGEIHHLKMDAMETDKSHKLDASSGAWWCVDCHREETGKQMPILAKVKRVEARHLGLRKPSTLRSRGFAHKPKPDKLPIPPRRLP